MVRSCLMIDLGHDTDGNNKFCFGFRFCLASFILLTMFGLPADFKTISSTHVDIGDWRRVPHHSCYVIATCCIGTDAVRNWSPTVGQRISHILKQKVLQMNFEDLKTYLGQKQLLFPTLLSLKNHSSLQPLGKCWRFELATQVTEMQPLSWYLLLIFFWNWRWSPKSILQHTKKGKEEGDW